MKREMLTVMAALISLGLSACSGEKAEPAQVRETVRGIKVVSARRTNVPDYLEAVGTVRAAQSSVVASQMMGNIIEIRAHEGDRVRRGQVLAVLDDAQPRASVDRATAAQQAALQDIAAAQSDLTLAQATLRRYQDLYEKKSVSPQEFDEVKARFESAQARRDMAAAGEQQARAAWTQANTSLDYTRVRAPFNGIVTEKKADAGTLASPGTPLFTLEDPSRYRLEAAFDESNASLTKLGASVLLHIDALNSDLTGKVAQIVPAADPASRSFLVKIDLPASAGIRSGMFGRAQIPRGERSAVVVPQSAVIQRGQLQAVYVLDANQVADLRYVTLGKTVGSQVEVLSGLDGDELVIAAPGDRELGGRKIEAQP